MRLEDTDFAFAPFAVGAANAVFVVLGLLFMQYIVQDAILWYWIALLVGGNLSAILVVSNIRDSIGDKPGIIGAMGNGLLTFGCFFAVEAIIITIVVGAGLWLLAILIVFLVIFAIGKLKKQNSYDILFPCLFAAVASAVIIGIIAGGTFSLVCIPQLVGTIASATIEDCENIRSERQRRERTGKEPEYNSMGGYKG